MCNDELNVAACDYDGGDCCSSTCTKSYIPGSCLIGMNCRDPAARTDKVPPTLYNVPSAPFERNASRVYVTGQQAGEVTASDNFPCFNATVVVSDVNVSTLPRPCAAGVVYHINRTWSVMDRAGNTASQSQLIAVVDDQWLDLGVRTLSLPLPSVRQTLFSHTFRVPVALPNKEYTWTLRPQTGTTSAVMTWTGDCGGGNFAAPVGGVGWQQQYG
jgi:hypothetical protein